MRETRYSPRGPGLAALEWGEPGDGLPTLLLHGWLDHAGSWARVAEALPGWRIAPDWRGHGRSDWVPEGQTYHFPEYVADLDALVAHLGGRVRLVGHSMGGTVATMYAGARPDAVERLVVVDGLGVPDSGAQALDRMRRFLDGVRTPRASRTMPDLETAAARLRDVHPFLDEAWARELAARGTRRTAEGMAWAWDPRHLLRSAVPYRQDQHAQFLRAIRCPTLTLHPARSPFAAEDVARLVGCLARNREVRIADAGHMVHLERPAEVAQEIAAFLREPGAGALTRPDASRI